MTPTKWFCVSSLDLSLSLNNTETYAVLADPAVVHTWYPVGIIKCLFLKSVLPRAIGTWNFFVLLTIHWRTLSVTEPSVPVRFHEGWRLRWDSEATCKHLVSFALWAFKALCFPSHSFPPTCSWAFFQFPWVSDWNNLCLLLLPGLAHSLKLLHMLLSTWDAVFGFLTWKTSICPSRPSSNISCSMLFLQVPQGEKWTMSSPNIRFFPLLFSSLSATGSSFAVFMVPLGRIKGLQLCLLPRQWPGSLHRSCISHVSHKSSGFSAGRRAVPHGRAPVCFLLSLHYLLQLPCYVLLFCPLSIALGKKLGPLI